MLWPLNSMQDEDDIREGYDYPEEEDVLDELGSDDDVDGYERVECAYRDVLDEDEDEYY